VPSTASRRPGPSRTRTPSLARDCCYIVRDANGQALAYGANSFRIILPGLAARDQYGVAAVAAIPR
jgi:hypothetical protein